MNYSKIYSSLILLRVETNPIEKSNELYTELHHIIPRCNGGSDEDENLVRLTAREHFIAHRLLAKIYPHDYSLSHAALKMSSMNSHRITSRSYSILREKSSIYMSRVIKEHFNNMTDEEKENHASRTRQQFENMSEEQIIKWSETSSKNSKAFHANLTEKQKSEYYGNLGKINKERAKNLTKEQRVEHSERMKEWHSNKTQEERAKFSESVRAGNKKRYGNMTPEQRKEQGRRISEGHKKAKAKREKEKLLKLKEL